MKNACLSAESGFRYLDEDHVVFGHKKAAHRYPISGSKAVLRSARGNGLLRDHADLLPCLAQVVEAHDAIDQGE